MAGNVAEARDSRDVDVEGDDDDGFGGDDTGPAAASRDLSPPEHEDPELVDGSPSSGPPVVVEDGRPSGEVAPSESHDAHVDDEAGEPVGDSPSAPVAPDVGASWDPWAGTDAGDDVELIERLSSRGTSAVPESSVDDLDDPREGPEVFLDPPEGWREGETISFSSDGPVPVPANEGEGGEVQSMGDRGTGMPHAPGGDEPLCDVPDAADVDPGDPAAMRAYQDALNLRSWQEQQARILGAAAPAEILAGEGLPVGQGSRRQFDLLEVGDASVFSQRFTARAVCPVGQCPFVGPTVPVSVRLGHQYRDAGRAEFDRARQAAEERVDGGSMRLDCPGHKFLEVRSALRRIAELGHHLGDEVAPDLGLRREVFPILVVQRQHEVDEVCDRRHHLQGRYGGDDRDLVRDAQLESLVEQLADRKPDGIKGVSRRAGLGEQVQTDLVHGGPCGDRESVLAGVHVAPVDDLHGVLSVVHGELGELEHAGGLAQPHQFRPQRRVEAEIGYGLREDHTASAS